MRMDLVMEGQFLHMGKQGIKMRKNIKSAVVMVLGFALTGAVLTGCGESRQPRQDIQRPGPESMSEETRQDPAADRKRAESETAQKTAQTSGGYEDNFAVGSKAA